MPFPSTAAAPHVLATLATPNLEALAMYGLVALVMGLIAWSKFNEPALTDPYAKANGGRDLPSPPSHGDLGPTVATPASAATKPAADPRR